MKLKYKRSTAATALAEPEETYTSDPQWSEPSPAPAGALHRVYPQGSPDPAAEAHPQAEAEEYVPQRGSYGMRLKGGIPSGLAGRILLGTGALVIIGAVTLTVAAVRQFLFHDERFLIASSAEIAVQGNEHISRPAVLGVFGADLERNIFKVPLDQRRTDLERLPWVAHATVERLLPNHLRVSLVERTPIAFVRQGTQIGLVDADGVLLDMPPESAGDPHYSFPVLTGLAPDDSSETRSARMEVYRRFMSDLDSGGARLTQFLSEVDVTNPEDVKALVTENGADILVHFGDENFLQRFHSFQKHLPEWRAQYPKLASADMRYERQVVLEMQGAAASAGSDSATGANASAKMHDPGPPTAASLAAATPAAHKVAVAARRPAAGRSAANDRIFKALAAHRAAQQGKNRAVGRR